MLLISLVVVGTKGPAMNARVTLMALLTALVLGLLGAVFVPSSPIAACKDPPGGTDCK